MRLLFIGDIVGSAGRRAIRELLPRLIDRHRVDFVVANAENAAGGVGVDAKSAKDLLAQPVDVFTGGNHSWRHKEIVGIMAANPERILRPYNFPEGTPGRGYSIVESATGIKIAILNLQGCVFMQALPCPFRAADAALREIRAVTPVVMIDFHAEATSEKRALGWHVAGRVSACIGTHTHVPTADEEILPGGTAYLTDAGMTGPYDSVIGTKKDAVLRRFLTMRPASFSAAKGDIRLAGALVDIDEESGKARSIARVLERLEVSV